MPDAGPTLNLLQRGLVDLDDRNAGGFESGAGYIARRGDRKRRAASAGRGAVTGAVGPIPEWPRWHDDIFVEPTCVALEAAFGAARAAPVVRHLAGYKGSVVPTKAWRRKAAEVADAAAVARLVLDRFLVFHEPDQYQMSANSARLVRAAVWTVPADPVLLTAVATYAGKGYNTGGFARCVPVATSAIAALAEIAEANPDAVTEHLTALRPLKNKTVRAAVAAAWDAAARGAGLSRNQAQERALPTFDLDTDGEGEHVAGGHRALLRFDGQKLLVRWPTAAGGTSRGAPAAVKGTAEHRALLGRAAAVKKAAAVHRARVEGLLALDERWSGSAWVDHHVGHPFIGAYSRRLVWEVRRGERWLAGLPERAGGIWRLADLTGAAVGVDGTDELRLWHPVRATDEEVVAWRHRLEAGSVRQPFKQVHRETYRIAPEEGDGVAVSRRFADHVVRYPQIGALVAARGWSAHHLGAWEGGDRARARKEFGQWRAGFGFAVVEEEIRRLSGVRMCDTGEVWFEQRGARAWRKVPLDAVPAQVFSEAMRDVDLFVSVASIATDPTWAEGASDRIRVYWHDAGSAAPTTAARARGTVLRGLLPRTRIAGRAEVREQFLVVRGSAHEYRIHLGTGRVQFGPSGTPLRLGPVHHTPRDRLLLPFDEPDGILDDIVATAFLLADDAAITDPAIRAQLG
jgi:hypothetical protein